MKGSEAAMLKEVWKRAMASDGLNVHFKTKAGAVRARMQLYNVVKSAKSHKDMSDLELVRAAEALEIVWVDETTIRLQKRSESDMLQSIAAALGVGNPDDFEDPAIKASREKLMKQLESLGKDEPELAKEHQPNQFYTR